MDYIPLHNYMLGFELGGWCTFSMVNVSYGFVPRVYFYFSLVMTHLMSYLVVYSYACL